MLVHEVGEEGIAPFRAPAWTGKAHREIPWWRRPGMLFIEAAVVISAVAVPAYFSLRSPPAIAFAERDWVVVGDLRNQTGQGVLDDSLDTAFRVSLEQSRFVNLVSSLQVNDALKRMQKPNDTKIDRAIGSEIAMREGARALILPTVAEVGGRVRVTAEVVDPHTQATVYAETADGNGLDSILPSVGKVSGELRGRLGEAVASIEANNAPLPKVTTSNLDALRAYSLGLKAYMAGRGPDAIALFEQATRLDADFALAYIGLARVYDGNADPASSHRYIDKAVALRDKLTERDKLYLDAWAARFGPVEPMLKKWQLLGQIYPDYYAAPYNFAYFSWILENRASVAAAAISPALSEHNPLRAGVHYTLAYLEAAENHFDAAERDFASSTSSAYHTQGLFHAAAYAAQRRFADAQKIFQEARPTTLASADVFLAWDPATQAADQGDWVGARSQLEAAASKATAAGSFYSLLQSGRQRSLDGYLLAKQQQIAELKSFIADAKAAVENSSDPNRASNIFAALFGAYLAARAEDFALAQATLTAMTPLAHGSGQPNLEHLLAIVEAELSSREGKPQDAIARLQPKLDGSELYLTHIALADAYAAAGKDEDALRESSWLMDHRGRAYLEINDFQMLQLRNVVESDLAILRVAEIDAKLGRRQQSEVALKEFLSAWPQAAQLAFVSPRLNALSTLQR